MSVPSANHLASDAHEQRDSVAQESVNASPSISILFDEPCPPIEEIDRLQEPESFADLNLDQVVDSITATRVEYNLKPFFYFPLQRIGTVYYRHEALRDLEDQRLLGYVQSFAEAMRRMREDLAQADKLYYTKQKQSWFLEAVTLYCETVRDLLRHLKLADIHSQSFTCLREYVTAYVESDSFRALAAETEKLGVDLGAIRYSIHVQGRRVTVSQYESLPDYRTDILKTFEQFQPGHSKEYEFRFSSDPNMNHVEAAVLDMVAQLHPEIFGRLDGYCRNHCGFLDVTIARFDREVQFYVACIDHIQRFKQSGLPFCYPEVSDGTKEVVGGDTFDLALADRLIPEGARIVTNDFFLNDPERILVVSGPNQGGKTTFARTFGQLHYLASLGLPVPGSAAKIFLFDRLFTHFEREENIQKLRGKLEDELLRIHRILQQATPNSILIMNESFLSTSLNDSLFLSREIVQRIIDLDMLCVSVTFLDEIASLGETTVSMVSEVNPKDPALRTFKIVRKHADGLAYAASIAEKYALSYKAVKERIASKDKEGEKP